ncbi:hypothetical protein MCC93_15490 [Morococcus cerebrosus]|uniref:Uncharacterized protein n=1 Tax=Morococcus cerebrosus TaxID=1056807 RepID=A0A0C1GZ53_9NEIS|nr:hypothetical protein MCC93_15490 [Morococcus cerebrosus]
MVLEKVLYDMTRCSQDMGFSQVYLNLGIWISDDLICFK